MSNRTKRSTATNNPALADGKPMIAMEEHAVLNGIKVNGQPVIVQIDFDKGICKGVIAGAKVGNKIIVDPVTGEKIKVPVGGHSYKVSTPKRCPDNQFVAPKVFVDGVQQKVVNMAARPITEANKGQNVCARKSVVIPLAGRTATSLVSDEDQQVELTGGFIIVVIKDRESGLNKGPGTIEITGFSKTAERTSWNI